MKNCIFAIFVLFGSATAIRVGHSLDPDVFRAMSKMPMPPLGNIFDTEFEFRMSNNELVEAISLNATYLSNEKFVYMMIPLDQVIMTGNYFSSLRVSMKSQTVMTQNNTGSYLLYLRGVNIRVKVDMFIDLKGVQLKVEENACVVTIQELNMMLMDDGKKPADLSTNTIRELLEFSTMEEYKKMFCNAMRLVAAGGVNSHIGRAILTRMQTTYTGAGN